MGKRQNRVFASELLQRQADFMGREVQVVLKSRQVFTGTSRELARGQLLLKNPRGYSKIQLSEIAEIVFDQESEF